LLEQLKVQLDRVLDFAVSERMSVF